MEYILKNELLGNIVADTLKIFFPPKMINLSFSPVIGSGRDGEANFG